MEISSLSQVLTANLFLFFFEMGSLYVAILELVLFVDQAGHRNHPASALPLLLLKVCTTTPSLLTFKKKIM